MDRFEASRLALARTGLHASAALDHALQKAVAVSANTLLVARVGIWLFADDAMTLHCVCQYDGRTRRFTSGAVLEAARWPTYLAALHSRKCVVADDARTNPHTIELLHDYLIPTDVHSMLDAPIFRAGNVAGVVCHEHVGAPRPWSMRDVDFASSVSDMLTALLEYAARLHAEEQLHAERMRRARNERMIALGRMAAGVAHDFNGILAATLLAADIFDAQSENDEVRACAEELRRGAEIGRRLVGQLLTFARRRVDTPVVLDAAEVLRTMSPILETLSSNRGRLTFTIADEPLRISIDRSQLEQLFMNLAINAIDMTPQGKNIVVSLACAASHRALEFRVADEGPGMADDVREHIFEPFFTTRSEEQGHGMGLATVFGIVEQANGTIEVTTEANRGTTFVVRLPLVRDAVSEGNEAGRTAAPRIAAP